MRYMYIIYGLHTLFKFKLSCKEYKKYMSNFFPMQYAYPYVRERPSASKLDFCYGNDLAKQYKQYLLNNVCGSN